MTRLYGIKNCDKIKKAKGWLEAHQVEYHFHDYRQDGLPSEVADWLARLGWQQLINRRSTSWRQLSEAERDCFSAADPSDALALLEATPTLIKRPLLVTGKQILVGFDNDSWRQQLL